MSETSWNQKLLITGLRLRRYQPRNPDWLNHVFTAARLLTSQGEALPWLGFLVDLEAWIEHGGEDIVVNQQQELASHPVLLRYQDVVLEGWRHDPGMVRIRCALQGRSLPDRREGLLFLLETWMAHGFLPGLRAHSGVLSASLSGWESTDERARQWVETEGWPDPILALVRATTQHFGSTHHLVDLGIVDLIERGLATMDRAPRVQMAQLMTARHQLTQVLGPLIPKSVGTTREIPSRERADGDVPLGGYSAITTRGRFESLVPSQLVWLDVPIGQSTLFAVKHERQELLYYSRHDNRLHQRLRHIAYIIDDSLAWARNKPKSLPFQKLTLVMACLYALWTRMEGILTRESLRLSWVFVGNRGKLSDECHLLTRLFASEVADGRIVFESMSEKDRDDWIEAQFRERGLFQPVDIILDGGQGFPFPVPNEQHRLGIMVQGDRLKLRDGKNDPDGECVWPNDWARTIGRLEELLTAT